MPPPTERQIPPSGNAGRRRPRVGTPVLDTFVDCIDQEQALRTLHRWARFRQSRYVCCCNVHSVISVRRDAAVRRAVMVADMVTPDGMPVVWMLRKLGYPGQQRINGPDLMWNMCALAERHRHSIFLYGSTRETLAALEARLRRNFPDLRIAGAIAPPFRPLSIIEDACMVMRINRSGANLVLVSLGCPKQELWMQAHRGRVRAVMIGVGAAFDYHAGTLVRAPRWMQTRGLEWLYRLWAEPRRLWKRYALTNSLFLLGAARQLFGRKLNRQTR